MSTELEIADAKLRLDEVLARARTGEEFVLTNQGEPVAKIVAVEDNPRTSALGMFKGQVWMSDDFNEPLTEGELKEWGL